MKAALLAALLACAAPAAAQLSFKAVPPRQKPALGDVFDLKFEAPVPGGYDLRPDTSALDGSDFGFVAFSASGGGASRAYTIKAQAFGVGISTFPALAWSGAGAPEGIKSPEVPIDIAPAFEKTKDQDIKDIYPPFRYIPWLWVALALLVAAAALWWLLRRRARLAGGAWRDWKDVRTPYQRASERLRKLAASPLAASPRAKDFYTGLTSILRLYLAEEFRIDAAQMTTADLSRDLKRTGADLKTVLKAREFLEKADLVKFARLDPGERRADAAGLNELITAFAAAAAAAREAEAEAALDAARAKGARE